MTTNETLNDYEKMTRFLRKICRTFPSGHWTIEVSDIPHIRHSYGNVIRCSFGDKADGSDERFVTITKVD